MAVAIHAMGFDCKTYLRRMAGGLSDGWDRASVSPPALFVTQGSPSPR